MAQPAPLDGERLPPPPRVPTGVGFPNHDASPREPRHYDCGHARPCGVKLRGWYHACPGCTRFERRKTRHWLIVGVVAAVLLGVTCSARASSVDPCAPYSPVDGKSCRKPTKLVFWAGVPVCCCQSQRVAGR